MIGKEREFIYRLARSNQLGRCEGRNYNFLDPSIFGRYSEFEKRYCILNQFYKPFKYLNTEELKGKIFAHAYRVTKVECLDLPEKLSPERYSLALEEKKIYKEMLKNYIEELDI